MHYDYDYDEYFYEPSKADEIIKKATNELKEMLTDEAKKILEDVKEASDNYSKLLRESVNLDSRIAEAKRELEALYEQTENAQIQDIPQRYLASIVRSVTKDIAPGDTVWVLETERKRKKCPLCDGVKQVSAIVNGTERDVKCPDCDGYGYIDEKYQEVTKKTVSSVELRLCFSENCASYWNRENIYVSGQGCAVRADKLFLTKENAMAAMEEDVKT